MADAEVLALVTLTRTQVLCWPSHDCKTKGDGAIPAWVFQVWAKHDIIKAYGL